MTYGLLGGDGIMLAYYTVPLSVRSNKPVFVSDSVSLKRNSKGRTAQRWEVECGLEPLRDDANALFVHMVDYGPETAFDTMMPQNVGVMLKRTSESTPTGTALSGADQLAVTGNVGFIPKGTFIRFSNHSKVYMTKTDLTDNGNVKLHPRLRMDVAHTFKHRDNVKLYCNFDTDALRGMSYSDGMLQDVGRIKLIEKI